MRAGNRLRVRRVNAILPGRIFQNRSLVQAVPKRTMWTGDAPSHVLAHRVQRRKCAWRAHPRPFETPPGLQNSHHYCHGNLLKSQWLPRTLAAGHRWWRTSGFSNGCGRTGTLQHRGGRTRQVVFGRQTVALMEVGGVHHCTEPVSATSGPMVCQFAWSGFLGRTTRCTVSPPLPSRLP
jgi:hypothetical protein